MKNAWKSVVWIEACLVYLHFGIRSVVSQTVEWKVCFFVFFLVNFIAIIIYVRCISPYKTRNYVSFKSFENINNDNVNALRVRRPCPLIMIYINSEMKTKVAIYWEIETVLYKRLLTICSTLKFCIAFIKYQLNVKDILLEEIFTSIGIRSPKGNSVQRINKSLKHQIHIFIENYIWISKAFAFIARSSMVQYTHSFILHLQQ